MNDNLSLTVKEWADEDKPREKMLNRGKKELSNAELIAILLRSGLQGKSAVAVAKEVLARADNSLTTLSQMEFSQLSSIKGLGIAKGTTLMAALELGRRMLGEVNSGKEVVLDDSNHIFRYMSPMLADLDHEEFWAIYLSNRNKVLYRQRIALGGQTTTTVDLRILFRIALEQKAVSLIVAHNHPSGLLKPSRDDRELTHRIQDAGKLLQIKLLDHIIIGISPSKQADYYSFHDEGLL